MPHNNDNTRETNPMRATIYDNPDHELLRDQVARFLAREVEPHAAAWEEAGMVPRDVLRRMGQAGLLGIAFEGEYGGGDADALTNLVFAEALSQSTFAGFIITVLVHTDMAGPHLHHAGNAAQKARYLSKVTAGELITAVGITEPGAGSDVAGIRTSARLEGNEWVLNGTKMFITNGVHADLYFIAAKTGTARHDMTMFIVEKGTPGFTVGRQLKKMGWWASDTAELFFDDCRVPVEHLIGAENMGFACIMGNFQSERLALALMANMTAQLALEESLNWARQREAFGKPIGKFQVLKHRLAEMATALEVSREFTYRQAAKMAAGKSVIKEISMAKNFATDIADRLTYDAVQIMGGMGYMRESLVERLYRDNRILSIGGGSREIMNEIISKQMGL